MIEHRRCHFLSIWNGHIRGNRRELQMQAQFDS
jgi:hypothetical protein